MKSTIWIVIEQESSNYCVHAFIVLLCWLRSQSAFYWWRHNFPVNENSQSGFEFYNELIITRLFNAEFLKELDNMLLYSYGKEPTANIIYLGHFRNLLLHLGLSYHSSKMNRKWGQTTWFTFLVPLSFGDLLLRSVLWSDRKYIQLLHNISKA